MRHHELANALVVVDMTDDHQADGIARPIHDFLVEHEDEYKIVLATKPRSYAQFHPNLYAHPDVDCTTSTDNIEFDSVFSSDGGYGSPSLRAALENSRGETLYDYLDAHGVARVDIVGVHVGDLAFEAKAMGFTTTVFAKLATAAPYSLTSFFERGVAVEGWK